MSERCANPDCPKHGTTPRAIAYRDTKARIVSNSELMDVIRVLAANADNAVLEKVGGSANITPLAEKVQYNVLMGNYDAHPLVQGILDGFISILQEHRPTQEFFANCQQVPEEEGFLTKHKKKAAEETASVVGGLGLMTFTSLDELMNFLTGGRRG